MASRTRWAGALPHALPDSWRRPVQIRGSLVLVGVSENWVSISEANSSVAVGGHPREPSERLYVSTGK